MSRLKHAFHLRLSDLPEFVNAWKNASPRELEGWEEVAKSQSISTAAMVWSIWTVINHQVSERGRINICYIEWLFRDLKMLWPYGTAHIPTATLGLAKCGFSILALTKENATI